MAADVGHPNIVIAGTRLPGLGAYGERVGFEIAVRLIDERGD
jgi:hypothetical protein